MSSINPKYIIQKGWLENRAYESKDHKDAGKGAGFRVYGDVGGRLMSLFGKATKTKLGYKEVYVNKKSFAQYKVRKHKWEELTKGVNDPLFNKNNINDLYRELKKSGYKELKGFNFPSNKKTLKFEDICGEVKKQIDTFEKKKNERNNAMMRMLNNQLSAFSDAKDKHIFSPQHKDFKEQEGEESWKSINKLQNFKTQIVKDYKHFSEKPVLLHTWLQKRKSKVYVVAGLLKKFVEDLKPFNSPFLREDFINVVKTKEITSYKKLVKSLPENTREILKKLVKLLTKFAGSEDNKMDSYALAKVFGPMMFEIPKREDLGSDKIVDIETQKRKGFKFLMDHYEEVFPPK